MKKILQYTLPLVYLGILIIPGWIFFSSRGGTDFAEGLTSAQMATAYFPLFGLYAVTFIWFQVILGSLMPLWERIFPKMFIFHRAEGVFALVFALLHPVYRAIGLDLIHHFDRLSIDVLPEHVIWLLVGYVQVALMIATVVTALMMKSKRFSGWWRKFHVANYVVFALAWLHGWILGSDVQYTGLRWLWMFFAVTAVSAVVIKVNRRRKQQPIQSTPVAEQ